MPGYYGTVYVNAYNLQTIRYRSALHSMERRCLLLFNLN